MSIFSELVVRIPFVGPLQLTNATVVYFFYKTIKKSAHHNDFFFSSSFMIFSEAQWPPTVSRKKRYVQWRKTSQNQIIYLMRFHANGFAFPPAPSNK